MSYKKRKDVGAGGHCKLAGCTRPVFARGGKSFDYCCKSHGKQDASSSSVPLSKKTRVEVKFEGSGFELKQKSSAWNETWAKIKDTIPPARTPIKLDTKEERYAQLVKYMLSGQTTDEAVDIAYKRLEATKLSIENILKMEQKELEILLNGVTGSIEKANRIQRSSQILLRDYDGDVPSTTEGLVALPGVGPKIATMALRYCWGINSGISVDVHIHRVCNRLGWVHTKDAVGTKEALEKFVPKDEWSDLCALYNFGKFTCTAYSPKCASCPVSQSCPSSQC